VLLRTSCLLQQLPEGNIEGTRRRGRRRRRRRRRRSRRRRRRRRRRRHLMHDLKEKRRYWKLK